VIHKQAAAPSSILKTASASAREPEVDRWDELLRQPNLDVPPSPGLGACAGKTILITGAGGGIGSALAKAIAATNLQLLILLDHSEENLYRIHNDLEARFPATPHRAILGDVGDGLLLNEIFDGYRPHTVYHAAAYKHVPLLEANPFPAVRNNVLGTLFLAQTCLRFEAARLIMISTDKAVNPSSVMGASKRIAELVLLSLSNAKTPMSAVRFGNVFGSTGSVVPLFLRQIATGGPLTVTHRDASRFFLTPGEAVELILAAASVGEDGSILIPKMPEPIHILDLAHRLLGDAGAVSTQQIEIIFTGLRPGEKLSEEISSARESIEPTRDRLLHRVNTPQVPGDILDAALRRLSLSVQERNLVLLLDTLSSVLPEYCPSETLLGLLKPELA
jgi:FlaA1/EpsC-like NDP-sugar epimerase